MNPLPQLELFNPDDVDSWLDAEQLSAEIKKWLLALKEDRKQPGACEAMATLRERYGWRSRLFICSVLAELREDKSLPAHFRNYLATTLGTDEISLAYRDGNKDLREFQSTVDELFQQSRKHQTSAAFKEAIEFMAKFRDYSPFNNMLVRLQNPGCSFFATARDWKKRWKRILKEDAKPLVILAPMHPIMLVYDIDQTEGPPLPQELSEFGSARGEISPDIWPRLVINAARDSINLELRDLPSTLAGYATFSQRSSAKMRIAIRKQLDLPSRVAVACHELAHIYLGHLGADPDGWWPCRQQLSHATVELEAEAVAHIVSIRLGLKGTSESYLAGYVGPSDQGVRSISMELIAKVSGRIETMALTKLPPRKRAEKS